MILLLALIINLIVAAICVAIAAHVDGKIGGQSFWFLAGGFLIGRVLPDISALLR